MYQALLTTAEVEKLCKLSRMTVYRMIRDGRLPVIRFGRQLRIDPQAIGLHLIGGESKKLMPSLPEKPKKEEPKKELSIFQRLLPELEKAFEYIPKYGEIAFRVIFHDSKEVRIEYSSAISHLLSKKEER